MMRKFILVIETRRKRQKAAAEKAKDVDRVASRLEKTSRTRKPQCFFFFQGYSVK
jgi:hypothetical protein